MGQPALIEDPGLGFADPVIDSTAVFRAVLEAMSRPGSIRSLSVAPADSIDQSALIAVALTLLDHDTPVWLDEPARVSGLPDRLAFHCGSPQTTTAKAAFALLMDPGGLAHLNRFSPGVPEFPDRSTTVVCALPALMGGPERKLTGPGIASDQAFAPVGLPAEFAEQWAMNGTVYPLGIDLILTSGESLLALPRTCRIEG